MSGFFVRPAHDVYSAFNINLNDLIPFASAYGCVHLVVSWLCCSCVTAAEGVCIRNTQQSYSGKVSRTAQRTVLKKVLPLLQQHLNHPLRFILVQRLQLFLHFGLLPSFKAWARKICYKNRPFLERNSSFSSDPKKSESNGNVLVKSASLKSSNRMMATCRSSGVAITETPLSKPGYNGYHVTSTVLWTSIMLFPLCISSELFSFPLNDNFGSRFSRLRCD